MLKLIFIAFKIIIKTQLFHNQILSEGCTKFEKNLKYVDQIKLNKGCIYNFLNSRMKTNKTDEGLLFKLLAEKNKKKLVNTGLKMQK